MSPIIAKKNLSEQKSVVRYIKPIYLNGSIRRYHKDYKKEREKGMGEVRILALGWPKQKIVLNIMREKYINILKCNVI